MQPLRGAACGRHAIGQRCRLRRPHRPSQATRRRRCPRQCRRRLNLRLALANLSSALNPAHVTVSEDGAQWDVASGDTGILGPSMRTAAGEASKPFLFVQVRVARRHRARPRPRSCGVARPRPRSCGMARPRPFRAGLAPAPAATGPRAQRPSVHSAGVVAPTPLRRVATTPLLRVAPTPPRR